MKTNKPRLFLYFFVAFFLLFSAETEAQKPFTVVLDAGHGGKDPGNTGNGFKEKEIALNIVLAVGKALEKNKNIKVVYTRKTDVFIELRERAAIANRAKADLFVSVHCNAHSSNAYGTETFILGLDKSQQNLDVAKKENQVIFLEEDYKEQYAGFNPNAPESLIGLIIMQEEYMEQSIEVASYIQENFTKQLKRNNRSVKQGPFWVLHNTYMPSVLIETGFLTNKAEGTYLNSKKGQNEMADAIAKAILKYYTSLPIYAIPDTQQTDASKVIAEHKDNAEEDIYDGVTFKVQIAASSKNLETLPKNFKGLDEISKQKEGNIYRYFYGSTSDYNLIRLKQTLAKQRGYTEAFVVAYKDGKLVKLADILKTKEN